MKTENGEVVVETKREEGRKKVTKKYKYHTKGVFWDVTPCDSCKNRRFGGT
jgi:hypothetical protein